MSYKTWVSVSFNSETLISFLQALLAKKPTFNQVKIKNTIKYKKKAYIKKA